VDILEPPCVSEYFQWAELGQRAWVTAGPHRVALRFSQRVVDVEALLIGSRLNATAVTAAEAHSCAALPDGRAQCWGSNIFGQLGFGSLGAGGVTPVASTTAVTVRKAGGGYLTDVDDVAAGGSHSCAVTVDGTAWCWGTNASGELGIGLTLRHIFALARRRAA